MQKTAPGWIRALEIILGLIALAVGITIIFYPGLTIATITFMLAIALFFVGLFRFFWGLGARNISGGARGAAVIIGLIAMGIAIAVMVYPLFAAATVVIFLSIGLLIYGIGRIIIGATEGRLSGGIRGLLVATGLLMIILAVTVMFYPGLGITFLAVLLSIAFLIIGFESIAAGIAGVSYSPPVPTSTSLNPE